MQVTGIMNNFIIWQLIFIQVGLFSPFFSAWGIGRQQAREVLLDRSSGFDSSPLHWEYLKILVSSRSSESDRKQAALELTTLPDFPPDYLDVLFGAAEANSKSPSVLTHILKLVQKMIKKTPVNSLIVRETLDLAKIHKNEESFNSSAKILRSIMSEFPLLSEKPVRLEAVDILSDPNVSSLLHDQLLKISLGGKDLIDEGDSDIFKGLILALHLNKNISSPVRSQIIDTFDRSPLFYFRLGGEKGFMENSAWILSKLFEDNLSTEEAKKIVNILSNDFFDHHNFKKVEDYLIRQALSAENQNNKQTGETDGFFGGDESSIGVGVISTAGGIAGAVGGGIAGAVGTMYAGPAIFDALISPDSANVIVDIVGLGLLASIPIGTVCGIICGAFCGAACGMIVGEAGRVGLKKSMNAMNACIESFRKKPFALPKEI